MRLPEAWEGETLLRAKVTKPRRPEDIPPTLGALTMLPGR
jgi:hypothetical protein